MRGLIGRQREIEAVARALSRAETSAVVLVGAPGVGKTRLLAEADALARDAGFATERITATRAAGGMAFGAVAQLLPPRAAVLDQADVLRQAGAHLAARGGERPLVLLVDDAHLLDDASATLVHQVVEQGDAFLIATQRAETATPDAISTLWKDGIAERLDVGPLGLADVEAMVDGLLDGPLDPSLGPTLFDASGGNPLFVLQLVDAGRRGGQLRPVAGSWRLDGAIPLPLDLVAAVEDRLGDLAAADRALLELIALGEPLSVDVAEDLAGDDGEAALERLERRGLLAAEHGLGGLTVRLAHPLYAEVLRDRAPASSARRARLQLAAALERRPPSGVDALRIAGWRLEAGVPLSADLAVEACEAARRRGDYVLAQRFGRAAVDAGGGFEAAMAVAVVSAQSGRIGDAVADLDRAAALATTGSELGRLAASRFDILAYLLEDYAGAFAAAADAIATIDDVDWRAELASRRAYLLALVGAYDGAAAEIAPFLDRPDLGPRALLWVSLPAAEIAWQQGRFAESLARTTAGREALANTAWVPSMPEVSAFAYIEVMVQALDVGVDEARSRAEADLAICVAEWTEQSRALLELTLATVERLGGRPQLAERYAAAAAERFRSPAMAAQCRAEVVMALSQQGRVAEAEAALAQIPDDGSVRPALVAAEAWCRAASGDLAAASAVLQTVATRRSVASPTQRALLLSDLARLGGAAVAVPLLEDIAGAVEGDTVRALLAHARATASRRPEELHRAAQLLTELGLHLIAAESAAAAAAAYERGGRAGPAAVCRALAEELTARCPGAITPGLAGAAAGTALSRRELEVAGLAAGGLTNRQIAERLGTSKRTVDSQLQRVYAKLGVGRDELGAALGRSVPQ